MAELRQLKPAGRSTDIVINGWREFVTRALAERVGVLADIVVAEALEESGLDERNMRLGFFNRFLAALHNRLPEELDRRTVIHELQADVLRRLFLSLSRDLKARIDRSQ